MTDFKDLKILNIKNCYSRALSQSFIIWRYLQNILFLKLWKSTSMTTYGCGKKSSLLSGSRNPNVLLPFSSLYETSDFALHPPNHPCLNLPYKIYSHLRFCLQRLTSSSPFFALFFLNPHPKTFFHCI